MSSNIHLQIRIKESGEISMQIIEGGVTVAKGFEAAAAAAGIKYQDRTDMALIYSEKPCKVAGTFTTNPAKEAAKVLGIDEKSVLVGSTGVIGMQLPMDRVKAGIRELALSKKTGTEAGTQAAQAIMTTDTRKKEAAVTVEIGDTLVTIGGMAKGSGMIHPNMCTMLAFITTDAKISRKALQAALSEDVQDTYNMISVDGDTSTNDTVGTAKGRLHFLRQRSSMPIQRNRRRHLQNQSSAPILQRRPLPDMMPTGAGSCAQWDTREPDLIRKKWICILRVLPGKYSLSKTA